MNQIAKWFQAFAYFCTAVGLNPYSYRIVIQPLTRDADTKLQMLISARIKDLQFIRKPLDKRIGDGEIMGVVYRIDRFHGGRSSS